MIASDNYREEITCDFAQYYHIYSGEGFKFTYLATLAWGLPNDSRTKMAMAGMGTSIEEYTRAQILDGINILIWQRTKDGKKGRNKPLSVAEALMHPKKDTKDEKPEGFSTGEVFKEEYARIISEIKKNGNRN